ncbi:hypothetical protein K439DRAFT_1654504 [Ramaria rubella]|nr:hypothetical protein K439DRAFT_1665479 [Ramaria rubella]KAF8579688.1 hypothetical protein K439DRAFT_1654504 [Ramaria rubella]
MPPRRRVRGGKEIANPGAGTKAIPQTTAAAQSTAPLEPPPESNFRRQLRNAGYRLVAIVIITLLTRYFQSDVKQFHSTVIPWKVEDLPGRGKGIIATRLIKQGERIITEKPLFTVPRKISGDPVALIDSQLKGLHPDQQAAFLELSYADSGVDIPNEKIPLSIFQTNGISAGESGVGIFPRTARLNHACSAGFNSVYTWREKEKKLVVHALKEVKEGEELLTTYFDTKRPRDARRDHLAQAYNFNCSCVVCSLPANESRASDQRLQSMSTSHGKFATWGNNEITGLEALNLVRQIWRTGEEEGYWSERGQLAADATHVAAAHSDEPATREWADLAQEWYGYELGEDSEQVENIRIFVDNPQQHVVWGTRDRMNVGGPNHPT